jgi:hypothetical protein|tara:strand:- start:434 stop:1468 length:1035 start_codon:yes stop_codon:yes gene_type:complete
MFKNLDPQDKSVRPFKAFKNFTSTNNDSGSGVFAVSAISSSFRNYVSSSDTNTQVGTTDYFALPTWNIINTMLYKNFNTTTPFHRLSIQDFSKQTRELHTTAQVISVGKDLYGEEIKPGSVNLSATVGGVTYDIRDDEHGNLYDNAFSSSFAAYKSSSFSRAQGVSTTAATLGSGSEVGNVFYEQGLLVVSDTGSYKDIGKQGNPFTLKHKATHTIHEHEYVLHSKRNEFNRSSNVSVTTDRTGFIRYAQTASVDVGGINDRTWTYRLFPPGDSPSLSGTGSFATSHTGEPTAISGVQHSSWKPYVTQIGLYDEFDDLLAVAKLAQPIKLSDEIDTTFVVRFDV